MTNHIISTCSDPMLEAEFVRPITKIVSDRTRRLGLAFQCQVHHASDVPYEGFKTSDRIIICGTAFQDDEYLKSYDTFTWLKACVTPVLGICSGMQIVAKAGGALVKSGKPEIGMVEITTVMANPLCEGNFQAYALHRNLVKGLEEFHVWAGSPLCTHVIAHRQRPQYGVLFHPEVRQEGIIERFLAFEHNKN